MDRARLSVEVEASPIPELEREDVRGCADLEHDVVPAGAVDRPSGDREVRVLHRGPGGHVVCGTEQRAATLGRLELVREAPRVDPVLEAQVDLSSCLGVAHVVALVLRVVHPEALADVVPERVNLERQVAAVPGVEQIEADRELGAEGLEDVAAEKIKRVTVDDGERRRTDGARAEAEEQAVLLRNAVEAPGEVRLLG